MTSHSTRWHPYRGGTSTSRTHPELTPRMAETQQGGAQDPKYIKYLLDPEEEYNCYFLVGNRELSEPEKIGVVKKMLLAHSLVFRRELQESHIKEKGIVEVSDMFPDTFKNLLRFVYGFDNTATLCFDEADDLFYVSEKYMITGLKARLATRLMQLLTPDNICSLMNNPACYSELELNSAICHILQGETGRVLATPQFLDLTGTALNRILEQEVLSVPEIELWRAALKWAKHKTGSDDGQVLRKQLAEQTKRIRICTFSDSELCGEVIPSGVVTGEEIQLVCVSRKKKEKLDALVDLCNEIQPRGKLNKSIVIKGVTEVNLLDHLSGSSDRHISKSLRLITKNNTLELWFFEFTARTTTNIPEGVKYLCDCTITISRITDYDNNTSAETPVTVVFREQVEYNKDFVVPVISNGQNVILLPNNKYTIKVTFTETHPMYFYRNKESSCTLDNEHFSLDYDRTSVFPKTASEWLKIASDFDEKWQFPHCLGAIDGKHVRIVQPKDSGSYYFNYKKTHSIVLMAIANAHCEFIYCDVGTNGRISDGGVINNTLFYEELVNKQLNIPEPEPVTFDIDLDYVFVGDDAFALRPDLIKPYSRDSLNNERKICNYRISRARRVVENSFGILASRFRIFHTAINLDVKTIESVVLACCALHNLLRKKSATYTPPDSFDHENIIDGTIQLGARPHPDLLHNLQRRSGGQVLQHAKTVREKFCTYFNGEGSVPWQEKFALNA